MQRTVAVLVTAFALLLASCASTGEGTTSTTQPPVTSVPTTTVASPTTPPTTQAPTTTVPPTAVAPPTTSPASGVIDWDDPTVVVELGDGWTIQKCLGDGPFLCVERDGSPVGALEAMSYPVDSIDLLDPAADPADNLATFAEGFYEAIGTDRAAGCGDDYGFDPIGPNPVTLGGQEGIEYGFTGTMADGSPSELNIQYATIVGDQIISIAAIAYDEAGCLGRDDLSTWDSASLTEFRPYLKPVMEVTPLPEL